MTARSRTKAGKAKRSPSRPPRGAGTVFPPGAVSHQEALAANLLQERLEAFTSALAVSDEESGTEVSGRRIKALHEVMRESYERMNSMLAGLDLDPPIACKSGCIHCCYNQIALTEPEALFLGMHLLETRDRAQLEDLGVRSRALTQRLSGKSWQEIGMTRHLLPCLFLENGNCSVYPARPFACRGWNSVDVNMCVRSNLTEDAMTLIENHPIMRRIADGIQKGILGGAKALGLEAGYLLMARSVSLLMEGGLEQGLLDCTVDWLRGKPFFARKRNW